MFSKKNQIKVEKYAERHYIKKFKKKYKEYWDVTWISLEEFLSRIGVMEGNCDDLELISFNDNIKIFKLDFRVHGTKQSKKGSGNRCILAMDLDTGEVSVLLLYHKGDLEGKNETAAWKKEIKENYPEYKDLF